MKQAWFGAVGLVALLAVAGCSADRADGPARGAAADSTTTTRPITFATPAGQAGVVPAAVGMASPVPVGQRTRVGAFDLLVSGPAATGDGKVIDAELGADSYADQGKSFLLVPVEVSRVSGATAPLPEDATVVLTYAGSTLTTPEDFATNCPYDEDWPEKVDLWQVPVAVGETLRGNACFIVSSSRADQFVLGYAPVGTAQGAEVYFRST